MGCGLNDGFPRNFSVPIPPKGSGSTTATVLGKVANLPPYVLSKPEVEETSMLHVDTLPDNFLILLVSSWWRHWQKLILRQKWRHSLQWCHRRLKLYTWDRPILLADIWPFEDRPICEFELYNDKEMPDNNRKRYRSISTLHIFLKLINVIIARIEVMPSIAVLLAYF